MGRRPSRDWESLVAAYEESGQTMRVFADEHGLFERTLRRWVARLGRPRTSARLLPVRLTAPALGAAVEVCLPDGIAIRVADAAPAFVAELVRALR